MNSRNETFSLSRVHGHITAHWMHDGKSRRAFDTHNMLSYSAADALAAAYGGDTSLVPKYMGFIYGNGTDAGADLGPSGREMSLETIQNIVGAIGNANVLITGFSRPPTISSSSVALSQPENENSAESDVLSPGDPELPSYQGNVVEFHAVTRTQGGTYLFDTSADSPYAGPMADGSVIYRVVLLGDSRTPCKTGSRYTVLAMADLKKNGTYRAKPASYELALDWRVTFE